MSAPPRIGVIIPVCNGARFLSDAFESIDAQDWAKLEVIIVDDGSTDNLLAVIARYGKPVSYLHQPRKGPAAARNLGIRSFDGDFIAFLDVDDRWVDGHLQRLFAALTAQPEASFAQGLMRQFVVLPNEQCSFSGAYRMPYLGSCLFRRNALEQLGYLDESMPLGEDYDLIFRCWELDMVKVTVDEVSLLYRRHVANLTRGKNPQANLAVLQRRIQRIRSGIVDPAAERRFDFQTYIGETAGFEHGQLKADNTWNR